MNELVVQKHLQTLVTRIGEAEALAGKREAYNDTEDDRKIINYIFHKLQAICTAWAQSLVGMGQDEKERLLKTSKREWLSSLVADGINQRHVIDYALDQVKKSGSPFMPTIGQFIKYCELGNIPEGTLTPLMSYKEISQYQCLPRESRQPWGLSPEVYHTLFNIHDHIAWRVMKKDNHKKYWDEEYQRTLKTLREGGKLHKPRQPVAVIENKRTPLDKPKAMSALQAMRESLK